MPNPTHFPEPPWTQGLLDSLGLQRGANAAKVYEKADQLATRLGPNTRRLWWWILILEGLAVLLPVCWLMVAYKKWPGDVISVSVALCTMGVVGFCWWMRWRNQQHAWTRSRLLAEFARSAWVTEGWPGRPTHMALDMAPSLQPLLNILEQSEVATDDARADLENLKQAYLKNRIEDQLAYYQRQAKKAAIQRQQLSRYVTHSLDGALILAVLGLWLGFSNTAEWLLSVAHSDLILGIMGAGLPLVAILMQSLSSYLELNRRTGRYAQQWEFLNVAKVRMQEVQDLDEAMMLVQEIERVLLSETTEWFYQAEHAEVFYRSGNTNQTLTPRQKLTAVEDTRWTRLVTATLTGTGVAMSFTGRIIFGRVLIMALTSVITALLIFSRAPQDDLQRSLIRTADGQLLSHTGGLGWWQPKKEEREHGFILIAHGLHDSARGVVKKGAAPAEAVVAAANQSTSEKLHWMTEVQQSIHKKLDPLNACPDICLVDWSLAAKPSEISALLNSLPKVATDNNSPENLQQMVMDVAAIRSQAQAIGDLVGYKLVQGMKSNPPLIQPDRPMHLIGHSAGGFLVVRVALVLQRFGLLPKNTRVTLLDTPLPDLADLKQLLTQADGHQTSCLVDYYKSSVFAQGVLAESEAWPNYRCYTLQPSLLLDKSTGQPGPPGPLNDHSYAHQWFIKTILGEPKENASAPGFRCSPFLTP